MAEKKKKLRIYKFASEYNLATDTLVEFLQQKGYKVKSHMSVLTDEMMSDIREKFKKDIETAEKHYRKISEFQKKHGEETDSEKEKTEKPEETDEEADEEDQVEDVEKKEEEKKEEKEVEEKEEEEVPTEEQPEEEPV